MIETRKLRVFLCHSSQDKPIVRELYQRLNAEGWIDPWLDEEKILPGQGWDMEIEKAVESSDVVLVFLSSLSVTKEGYIQKELNISLNYALYKPEGTIFIVPLRLDECSVPFRLRHVQYVDYFPATHIPRALKKLLQTIEKLAVGKGVKVNDLKQRAMKKAEEDRKREVLARIRREVEEKIRQEEEVSIRKKAEENFRRHLKKIARKQAKEKILMSSNDRKKLNSNEKEKSVDKRNSQQKKVNPIVEQLFNYDDAEVFYFARLFYGNGKVDNALSCYAELVERKILIAEVIIDLRNISYIYSQNKWVWQLLASAYEIKGDHDKSLEFRSVASRIP